MLLFTLTTDAKAIVSGEELDSLLYAVAAENRDALERLYRRTCASVYSFALSVLKDPHDAEDVLQEAYLAIWRGAVGYASRGKPMAWMMTITRNLCLQRLRERERSSRSCCWSSAPAAHGASGFPGSGRRAAAERRAARSALPHDLHAFLMPEP